MRTVGLIKHEAVPKCGPFEVRFSDRTPSKYFCVCGLKRSSKEALRQAKAFARAVRDGPK